MQMLISMGLFVYDVGTLPTNQWTTVPSVMLMEIFWLFPKKEVSDFVSSPNINLMTLVYFTYLC